MSTPTHKPFLSDEQVEEMAESFIDRKTTLPVGSGRRANRETLVQVFGEEVRDAYEQELSRLRSQVEVLREALEKLPHRSGCTKLTWTGTHFTVSGHKFCNCGRDAALSSTKEQG